MSRTKKIASKLRKRSRELSYEMDRLYRQGDKKAAADLYCKINDLDKESVEVYRRSAGKRIRNPDGMSNARKVENLEARHFALKMQKELTDRESEIDKIEAKSIAQKIACFYNED